MTTTPDPTRPAPLTPHAEFGGRLRGRRRRAGFTQAELAQKVGVTPLSVNRWEMGYIKPQDRFIDRLGRLFPDLELPARLVNDFPQALRRARRSRHLTQDQLAEAIGVSRRTVWNWEQGDMRPQPFQLGILERVVAVKLTQDPLERDAAVDPDFEQRDELRKTLRKLVDDTVNEFPVATVVEIVYDIVNVLRPYNEDAAADAAAAG